MTGNVGAPLHLRKLRWTTVLSVAVNLALLVALMQWVGASGLLLGTAIVQDDLTNAFLVIAAATGGFLAIRYGDIVYPGAIALSAGVTFIAQHRDHPGIAANALIVCIGMLVVVILVAFALVQRQRRNPHRAASRKPAKGARRVHGEWWGPIEENSSIMRH